MPISSTEISALAGGFNQQVMLGMQHSAAITQQFGGYAPNPATQPVPTQGQNFANLMTMAGGQAGLNRLQQMGGQGLGGMASGFAQMGLSQMMYGAQQQQMFQTNMQQAYRFPSAQGGRGFNQMQLQGMGANIREMALERGPGGEQTSFEELSRLASNMGRMGLAQNVRSVKEFNEKFREMVSTVKTMATELGTSLEDAQKMMASMKGSGIFRNQAQVAQMMRQGALAGNISTAELSAGAMMGSQISRSIGGLGRSGAMAGMRAATNVGVAGQAGVLSEEDIYNQTGLTGAEGRQAMTQNMLQSDAAFFRSGLGRRALAAMAGRGGKLDAQSLARFQAGGVGTGETMGMAGRNLGKIGRADFLLNEGRLRGEAMASFGGMGKAMVARGWLEERGLDPNSARGQLFLQRKFNMSREEAENLGKMVEGLPLMQQQQRMSQQQDTLDRSLETAARKTSPTEVIKRFEQARDKVNDKIRQFGADVNSQTAGFLDNLIGKISKNYERQVDRTLAPALSALREGQGNAGEILEREFGIGAKGRGATAETAARQASRAFRGLPEKGRGPISPQQLGGFLSANFEALKKAGYDPTEITSVEQVEKIQEDMRRKGQGELVGRLTEEGKFATVEAEKFARGADALRGARVSKAEDLNILKDPLQAAGLFAGGKGTGVGRAILGLEKTLTDRVFTPLADKQKQLLESGAAGEISRAPRGAIKGVLGFLEKKARGVFGDEKVTGLIGQDVTGRVDEALGGVLGEGETRIESLVQGLLGGAGPAQVQALTEFMDSQTGKNILRDAFSADEGIRDAARDKRDKRIQELRAKGDLSPEEQAELTGSEAAGAGEAYIDWLDKNKGKQPTDEDWAEMAKKTGIDPTKVRQMAGLALRTHGKHRDESDRLLLEEGKKAAQTELGLLDKQATELGKLRKEGKGKLSPETDAYLKSVRAIEEKRAGAQTAEEMGKADVERGELFEKEMERLSPKQQRERAEELRNLPGATEDQLREADRLDRRTTMEERFARAGRGGRAGGQREIGRMLGVGLTARELRGKTAEQATDLILEKSGISDSTKLTEEVKKDIKAKLTEAAAAKTPAEKAKIMETIQRTHGGALGEAKKEQQDKKAEQDDPGFRKMGEVKTAVEQVKTAVNQASTAIVNAVQTKPGEGAPKKP